MPSTNMVEDESGEKNSDEVGGGITQNDRSMEQVIRNKHKRRLLEERRSCQLLMEIWVDNEGAPVPSAGIVYKVLTKQLGLSKDPCSGVNAI